MEAIEDSSPSVVAAGGDGKSAEQTWKAEVFPERAAELGQVVPLLESSTGSQSGAPTDRTIAVTSETTYALAPQASPEPELVRRLGGFEVRSLITPLDRGELLLVRDPFNRQPATAIVREIPPDDPSGEERLLAERAAWSRIAHPACPRILSIEREADRVAWITTPLDGESLAVRQQRLGNFSSRTTARWTRDMARLVAELAEDGIAIQELDPALIVLGAGQELTLLPSACEALKDPDVEKKPACRRLAGLMFRLTTGRQAVVGQPLEFPAENRPPAAIEAMCRRLHAADEPDTGSTAAGRRINDPTSLAEALDAWLAERPAEEPAEEFWDLSIAQHVGVTFVAALVASIPLLETYRLPISTSIAFAAAAVELLVRWRLRKRPRQTDPPAAPPMESDRAEWPRWLPLDRLPAPLWVGLALLPGGGVIAALFGATTAVVARRRIPIVAGAPWLDARLGAVLAGVITLIPLYSATPSQTGEIRLVAAAALPVAMVLAALLGTTLRCFQSYDQEEEAAWFPTFLGILVLGVVGIAMLLVADWKHSLPPFEVPTFRFGLARLAAAIVLGMVWGLRLGRSLSTPAMHRALVTGGIAAGAGLRLLDWQAPEFLRLIWVGTPRFQGAGFSWLIGNLLGFAVIGVLFHLAIVQPIRWSESADRRSRIASPSPLGLAARVVTFVVTFGLTVWGGTVLLPPAIRCHLDRPWRDDSVSTSETGAFGIPLSPFRQPNQTTIRSEIPVLLSADGQFLLTYGGNVPQRSDPWNPYSGTPAYDSFSIWDTATGKRLWKRPLSEIGNDPVAAFSSDGQSLSFLLPRPDHNWRTPTRLVMHNSRSGEVIESIGSVLAVSPSGKLAVVATPTESGLPSWEVRTLGRGGEDMPTARLPADGAPEQRIDPRSFVFSPDDRWLTASLHVRPHILRRWDFSTAGATTDLPSLADPVYSPDGGKVAVWKGDGASFLDLLDTKTWTSQESFTRPGSMRILVTGNPEHPIEGHRDRDDRTGSLTALLGGVQVSQQLVDLRNARVLYSFPGTPGVLNAGGTIAATSRFDLSGSVLVYDLTRRRWILIAGVVLVILLSLEALCKRGAGETRR